MDNSVLYIYLYFVFKSFLGIKNQRKPVKNLQFCPESLELMLEFGYFLRELLAPEQMKQGAKETILFRYVCMHRKPTISSRVHQISEHYPSAARTQSIWPGHVRRMA